MVKLNKRFKLEWSRPETTSLFYVAPGGGSAFAVGGRDPLVRPIIGVRREPCCCRGVYKGRAAATRLVTVREYACRLVALEFRR